MGFNLMLVFVAIPLTGLFLLIWLFTKEKAFGKLVGLLWVGIFGLISVVTIIHLFADKKEVSKSDIYGEYVIDRTKFPGKQADWQYNHFRFEITKRDEFIFRVTDSDKIIKSYTGTVSFLESYKRPRIVIKMDTVGYHVINKEPTLYRGIRSFYYVFESPKFGNVFFTKGHWKPVVK